MSDVRADGSGAAPTAVAPPQFWVQAWEPCSQPILRKIDTPSDRSCAKGSDQASADGNERDEREGPLARSAAAQGVSGGRNPPDTGVPGGRPPGQHRGPCEAAPKG